jgi:hypothetical protein
MATTHRIIIQMKGSRRGWVLLLCIGVLGCILLGFVAYSALAGSSGGSPATQAALRYARAEMVWLHGPTIVHERTATLGELPALLPSLANTTLRKDVNTADLIRQYGPNKKVDIVVLSGVYNSLPPDEGVDVQGEVLVLVDAQTNRVLFLTA